jgi:class 3 adenylate cyclase
VSRIAPLDKALVLILVPLWVVCFALGVRTQLRGTTAAHLGLSVADAGTYPVLTGEFSSITHASDPLAAAGLRAGDRLIRLGDADLLGVSTRGFCARSLDAPERAPLVFERDGQRHETTLELASTATWRPLLATSFAFAVSALFLLLRARPTPAVRAYFLMGMAFAFANCAFPGSQPQFYPWFGMCFVLAGGVLMLPLTFRFLFRFPDDRPPEGRWYRIWPWFFAVNGLFSFLQFSSRIAIGEIGGTAIGALGAVALLVTANRKYHRAERIARRQMKWAMFGVYGAALPFAVAAALTAIEPRFGWLFFVSFWALPLFPLALVISVLRFNLFDIDRILSAAASYNVLAVVLGAGALIVVPRVAEAASGLVGIDPGAGQVALSLVLAAVLIPAHRRLRPQIDRVFFKERYALDHGIAELLPELTRCRDARDLTQKVGEGLHGLLRPEACVVYAGVEESYAPVFAEGRAVPPAFEAASPLVGTLRGRRAPLSLSDAGRRPDEAPLGPFDRAALETLEADVVVPVQQDDALAAFLCLGPKRSGDVYTSTDLSLLAAVAETVSHQLRRFDQEATTRQAQAMQESLRRYVPGAVADQLASGVELSSGECEVSVLFVDIRGYTGFAEGRKAEEIFSTVNRYTETVSHAVQKHGGSVVEFNGDGMMTVFGAPRELAHKERAAVEAGREIVEAVGALPVEGGETLSVGVGIATGTAFVGNIQAADRMIWSAIGNTTNLAARLQTLTRELGASLVIDAGTWERAQTAAQDFEKRPAVPIRGRREARDVYVLAMRSG